jgi:hypothetical protein
MVWASRRVSSPLVLTPPGFIQIAEYLPLTSRPVFSSPAAQNCRLRVGFIHAGSAITSRRLPTRVCADPYSRLTAPITYGGRQAGLPQIPWVKGTVITAAPACPRYAMLAN